MGTLKNGFFGGFTGKVGNLVGSSCRGVEYVKSRPTKMTNPRTKKQTKQRSKFTLSQNFLRSIVPIIRIGFKDFAVGGMSAFNAAKRKSANASISLPTDWSGDVIETYIAFKNEEGTMVSNSCYTGSLTV